MRVLVTGATGYIGGRLVPELLARGHEVRCAARTPAKLDDRPWRDQVEVATVDVFDRDSLDAAVAGCDAVHFLIHSMDGQGGFADRDRQAAANVRDACAAANVSRIVYLGGLGSESDDLSPHLRSRHEVGRVLADGPVPVTELRAAIIIGSGSASFEMLRNLVDVLPVMTTPRWVSTLVQPIAIRDVLYYLCEVLEIPATAGRVIGIGGPEVMSYQELMQTYAEVSGLGRRVIVPVPVLTPGLSSLWIGLVTPLPPGLARPLVESLVNEVVVEDDLAAELMPRDTLPFPDAVRAALARIQDLDAVGTGPRDDGDVPEEPDPSDADWSGGAVLTERHRAASAASPEALFASLRGTAREVGDRIGRRRVELIEPPHRLRVRAERRLPGRAWIDLEVRPGPDGRGSILEQVDRFHPRGLSGRLAWFAARPWHAAASARQVRQLADDASGGAGDVSP